MSAMSAESDAVHAQALSDLEAGKPLAALMAWRQLLVRDASSVAAHLEAATATLPADDVAPSPAPGPMFSTLPTGSP